MLLTKMLNAATHWNNSSWSLGLLGNSPTNIYIYTCIYIYMQRERAREINMVLAWMFKFHLDTIWIQSGSLFFPTSLVKYHWFRASTVTPTLCALTQGVASTSHRFHLSPRHGSWWSWWWEGWEAEDIAGWNFTVPWRCWCFNTWTDNYSIFQCFKDGTWKRPAAILGISSSNLGWCWGKRPCDMPGVSLESPSPLAHLPTSILDAIRIFFWNRLVISTATVLLTNQIMVG